MNNTQKPLPAQAPCQTSCACGGTGGSGVLVLPALGCREAVWPAAPWRGAWAPRWSDWSCWCWAWGESHWRSRDNNAWTRNRFSPSTDSKSKHKRVLFPPPSGRHVGNADASVVQNKANSIWKMSGKDSYTVSL